MREAAGGGVRGIHLDRDPGCFQLGYHFIEIANAEIHHPDLVRISEILGRLGERAEDGGPCLLVPDLRRRARRRERNPKVLLVPTSQRIRIVSSEEESSDSRDLFHRALFGQRRPGCLRSKTRLPASRDDARSEGAG